MSRHRSLVLSAAVVALLTVAGCHSGSSSSSSSGGSTAGHSGTLAVGDGHTPMPAANSCTAGSKDGQPLPDPHCTPGAINPQVNESNINQTVCSNGWTKTIRPPSSKTGPMKKASALSYHQPAGESGEYDHLISLELGGAPDDPRNLWVEPGKIPNPKDAVENKLHDAVCSNLIPLATAQQAIAANWVTAYDDAGLRVNGGKVCLRDNPARCATGGHGDDTSDG